MKVTYTADDGTVFDSADECLAHEALYEKWEKLVANPRSDVRLFMADIINDECRFIERRQLWQDRRRFVELAATFIKADPTLKRLIG